MRKEHARWFSRARRGTIRLNYLALLDSQVLPDEQADFSVQAFFSLMTAMLPSAALSVHDVLFEVQADFSEQDDFPLITDMSAAAALSVQAALSALQHAPPEDFWLAVQPPTRPTKARRPAAARMDDFFMELSENLVNQCEQHPRDEGDS